MKKVELFKIRRVALSGRSPALRAHLSWRTVPGGASVAANPPYRNRPCFYQHGRYFVIDRAN